MLVMDRPVNSVDADEPLTLEAYLGMPEDTRAEIVDGVLRPMSQPNMLHRIVQRRLTNQLEAQSPRGLWAADERILIFHESPPDARIPDVMVFKPVPTSLRTNNTRASDVLLVVEVVSPSTRYIDRREKLVEYARNGIPAFWRIELDPEIAVHVYRLADGVYREEGVFRAGDTVIDPTLPWAVVEVDDLAGDY